MITSCLLVLIMVMIWKTHILLIISYIFTIGAMELLCLSSVLYKFDQGGYLPLVFAVVLMSIMFVWNNVYQIKYNYEFDHKISPARVKDIMNNMTLYRMRLALHCSIRILCMEFRPFSSIMLEMYMPYTQSLSLSPVNQYQ